MIIVTKYMEVLIVAHDSGYWTMEDKSRQSEAIQGVFEGMEDWVPEDEAEEFVTVDEEQELWRIVDKRTGLPYKSRFSSAFNKPYYATERGAKSAIGQLDRNRVRYTLQKGVVQWNASTDL